MWFRRVAAAVAALATVVLILPGTAWAASSLTLSKASGLADGERITVTGSGFTPNIKQIAIGQCIAEVAGPTDCNLAGGAQFVNADANGKIPSVTLKLSIKFGSFDCTKRQCVIAAQLLPSGASDDEIKKNKTSKKISFGKTGSTASPKATGSSAPTLAKTGPGDEHWVIVLGATALLLPGIGLVLLMPARLRRRQA
ncbi:neocarzinostatin apoprotein domain-containing protein [Hamadaea sp. NPDC051192]|uniref:neocarzinostatin apoprotein domain-containing protein n=1 Tax=Hamadaea sp. NPDC051192 TaxID=3154940 RepID=UPI003414317D